MTQLNPGDRVGALSHSQDGEVFIFGFGKYVGRTLPREAAGVFARAICEAYDQAHAEAAALAKEKGADMTIIEAELVEHFGNPCIELDNGKRVYGCECWWGPEDQIRKKLEPYAKVTEVDIDEARRRVSNPPAEEELPTKAP